MDNTALFQLGYGLYVLTAHDDGRDNGCVINTAMQITSGESPTGVIAVNKQNLTHDMVLRSGKFNVSVLTADAPFELFKRFGFQSGRNADKFAGFTGAARSGSGVVYLTNHANAYLSFEVTDSFDFDTHTMFKANIADGKTLSRGESVTYAHYHKHIKPKPQAAPSGYICGICGYVYEGDALPGDFICPLCKHGASDFTKRA